MTSAATDVPPIQCSARLLVALFLIVAALDVCSMAARPLVRVQESRVLETAREMLDSGGPTGVEGRGWRGWMIPHLNGEVRLQKPPLAYWAVGAADSLVGVSVFAGRLPVLLARWGTAAVLLLLGARMFNRRTGIIAAGVLFGLLFFQRYGSFAETDIFAAFFLTAAAASIWECRRLLDDDTPNDSRTLRFMGFANLSAASMAGIILSKGPPALFVILFLIAFAFASQRPALIWRWVKSGAPATLLVLAAPWFVYVATTPEAEVLRNEMNVVMGGGRHTGPPWYYLVQMFGAAGPWAGFFIFALAGSISRWKENIHLRGVLILCLSILVPLSFIGQKQEHYLLPMMPAVALLIGWAMDRAASGFDRQHTNIAKVLLGITLAAVAAGPVVIVVGLFHNGKPSALVGGGLIIAMLAAGVLALVAARRHGWPGLFVAAPPVVAAVMIGLFGVWTPQFRESQYVLMAEAILNEVEDIPCASWKQPDPRMLFYLQRTLPVLGSADDLDEAFRTTPNLRIINKRDRDDHPPEALASLEVEFSFEHNGKLLELRRRVE